MHKFDFKNRTAVITGGAQGFGLDISKPNPCAPPVITAVLFLKSNLCIDYFFANK